MIDDVLTQAERALPEHAETIAKMRLVRQEAFGRPYAEFIEPKSAFDLSGDAPQLLGPFLSTVEAWATHMAYFARTRMLAIEPILLTALSAGCLTPAMVLLRSHAETAGLACLALLTLRDGPLQRLRGVVQRTLFGGALARTRKRFPELADVLPLSESQPPATKDLMEALDQFAGAGGKGNGRYQAAYGLLCEYGHPNSRGALGFARSVEVPPLGWRIRYTPTEVVGPDEYAMVLSLLLEFMCLGYAASEFLRLGTVEETAEGFSITPPAPLALKRILTKLMLLGDVPAVEE